MFFIATLPMLVLDVVVLSESVEETSLLCSSCGSITATLAVTILLVLLCRILWKMNLLAYNVRYALLSVSLIITSILFTIF